MSSERTLRALYRDIPKPSPCRPNCGDCCGPVPWNRTELARVQALAPAGTEAIELHPGVVLLLNPAAGSCAFLEADKGCTVYAHRPFICRLFAAADEARMMCPHGCRAQRPLSRAQAGKLTQRYGRTS